MYPRQKRGGKVNAGGKVNGAPFRPKANGQFVLDPCQLSASSLNGDRPASVPITLPIAGDREGTRRTDRDLDPAPRHLSLRCQTRPSNGRMLRTSPKARVGMAKRGGARASPAAFASPEAPRLSFIRGASTGGRWPSRRASALPSPPSLEGTHSPRPGIHPRIAHVAIYLDPVKVSTVRHRSAAAARELAFPRFSRMRPGCVSLSRPPLA